MEQIEIRKEFKDILSALAVEDKFMKNLYAHLECHKIYGYVAQQQLNNTDGFATFLLKAFPWDETPEKKKFWLNIMKKGRDYENKV